MDFEQIKAAAQGYRTDMCRFLREMISHPSESCEEKEVVHCIKAEMEKLGYDKVEVDGLGPGDWLWAEAQQRERLAIPSAFEKFTAELKEGE